MKIAFFGIKPDEKKYIQSKLQSLFPERSRGITIEFFGNPLDKNSIPKNTDFDAISVFVNSQVDKDIISKFKKLKLITTRSTGFDHIDLKTCKKKKITVVNVPSYGENTVAEFSFALILALSRKVYQSYDQIRETGSFNLEDFQGFDLKGKTLGVIGTGRIGRHSIKIAKGFGMRVLAYDKYPSKGFEIEAGFFYVSLNELLEKSDVVTLHVPYNKETHHLINKRSLSKIKKGSILINTSRGGVVETGALVRALQNKQLAGAGLDVLEEEGIIKDEAEFLFKGHPKEDDLRTLLANHVLIDMPNVIITPHNAFNTEEALNRILDTTAENITAFIEGKPINIVG
ncbi:MAG: hydroxyacid dehydrogenase [bacterium]